MALLYIALVDLGVDHGCGNVDMAEKFLNFGYVHTVPQGHGGCCVPDQVRIYTALDACLFAKLAHDFLYACLTHTGMRGTFFDKQSFALIFAAGKVLL